MIRDQIQNTDEYQHITSEQKQEAQAQQSGRDAETVGDALTPLLDAEKGDILFWTQVLQLIVLLAIYRELRGA